MQGQENHSRSTQIALGGVFSGLCLVLMFMSSLFPFSEYAVPALAGAMLMIVYMENGSKVAWMVYISVSLLSLFTVPNLEAAFMFIGFFGYYPIVKFKIERLKSRFLQFVLKIGLFNLAMVAAYYILINLFGMSEVLEEFADYGDYMYIALLLLLFFGNVVMLIFDRALTNFALFYRYRLRNKLVRK